MLPLLSEIRSVKLRGTRIERDNSAPRLHGDLDDISDSYDTTVSRCNIENWLPILGPPGLTFETLLVPLTTENAHDLIRAFEDIEESTASAPVTFSDQPLNQHEAVLRAALSGPLQIALDRLDVTADTGCIVKTSSRSPKDAAARTGVLERILRQSLSLPSNKAAVNRGEEMMRVVCEAEGTALRFSSATDILRALVLSERIWQEFRCFLHDGHLTAISQYAYRLFSPELIANADAIRSSIVAYFDAHIRDLLVKGGFETCIVDVALLVDGDEQWRPRVIEVNPFLPTTDAALFSWGSERDVLEGRRLLDNEQTYPLMRVCDRAQQGLPTLPKAWREVVERVRQELLSTSGEA